MKISLRLIALLSALGILFASCEGPAGPQGQDANETCKVCHNSAVVEKKATEYQFSKHDYGEAAFEEAGNTGCTPCHTSDAFKYVCKNNTPASFTLGSNGKYSNDYATVSTDALGEFNCTTCHVNLHTTYEIDDFLPLTNIKAVSMTMWKGTKSIDLQQDGGSSNLCIKCHQPRPLTTSTTTSNGDVVDYTSLISSPNSIYYDSSVGNAAPNKVIPSYRTHVHYGTVGAIYAGQGGVQFSGSQTYTNSSHTTVASCNDCHMATVNGRAGGHTFRMRNGEGALTSSTTWQQN